MSDYRLYSLDDTGKITGAELIEARDDGEAMFFARIRTQGAERELWEGSRFVGRLMDRPIPSKGEIAPNAGEGSPASVIATDARFALPPISLD